MTINRQNGCFVPFYTMVVSPSMFGHSSLSCSAFSQFVLCSLRRTERFDQFHQCKPDHIHKECCTHQVSEIHLRCLYVCKELETICFRWNGIPLYLLHSSKFFRFCVKPDQCMVDKQPTDIQSSAVYFVVFS
jgi:hypothetical protein